VISSLHSLDSRRLADEVARNWTKSRWPADAGRRLPVFSRSTLEGESSKSGIAPSVAADLAHALAESRPELSLEGLMCIPEPGWPAVTTPPPAEASIRGQFSGCARSSSLRPSTQGRLSMGMSSDFEIAIEECATPHPRRHPSRAPARAPFAFSRPFAGL